MLEPTARAVEDHPATRGHMPARLEPATQADKERAVLETEGGRRTPTDAAIKRALDLGLAGLAFVLALPLMAVLAALVALDSPGPALYGAVRLGRDGRRFRCWKFRSMHLDAEAKLADLLERDPEARAEYEVYHKLRHDPRVTRFGRWLRRTSLDELPQVFNVLVGDMSLVGPRPYLPREQHKVEPHTSLILSCRPGITGWWQVSGRSEATFEERVRLDLHYIRHWSPKLDALILARTVVAVLVDRKAH